MKIKFALSAGLVLLSGLGLAFAGQAKTAAVPAVTQEDAKVKEFKDILFKLVRQDEYLDEAIESLDSSAARPDAQELSALGVSLKSIAKNLNHVSALNKAEFTAIQPDTRLATYTNTILSYSRKVDRKAGQVGALIAQLAVKNKKAAMRDAVTTRKNGKKARGGKQLTQILEEQKAVERLALDAKTLRGASRNLTATSKWLYIASK
ncbi:MAG: hypothetical protein A2X32_03505 [Elusimicrobia bacterium GWC2_64_44]|nr:MAG: hypothetical protein A2X32_03505 [Elusimicrobia bacterium GWC2_64_44]